MKRPILTSGFGIRPVLLLLALLSGTVARGADWSGAPLPQTDRLFQRTNDWVGADGDFAVALTNGLTLWLFSDTFVGDVRDGHRRHTTMINNSAAWQHGVDPAAARVEFFHRQTRDGKPASLITPADGRGWFWLFDSVMARGSLFLFLEQIEPGDASAPAAFAFRQTATWLAEVSNPLAPPPQWQIRQRKVPFAKTTAAENRWFGSATLKAGDFIYVFGTRDHPGSDKKMILARVPAGDPADFSAWQFRTREGWSADPDSLADLCDGMASEYSVSRLPVLNQYVLICTENGLSEKIVARTAPDPWGPWSEAKVVFRCPEMAWDKQIFCYAAKAHPMLATRPDELIVTYAANSFELPQLMNDARLYWPRFVRVTLR